MNETLKTAAFAGAAVASLVAASIVQPERRTPAMFSDEGQSFYPQFKDPQAVKAIEVVDYDESTATARPLKVEFRKNRWVIASNDDYPIDIGDRLAKTAGALADLHKDQVRSDNPQDHAKYGVIDPLDQKVSSLQGRGKRVTLRDARKEVLADFIFGKAVENKAGWRYARIPGQKRTYAVKTEADPSARFADWVNSGLLRMPTASIRRVNIVNYAVNEMTGTLGQPETITLTQENSQWKSAGGETVREDVAKSMAAALDGLKITGARPKPPEMSRDLRAGQMQLSMQTALTLRQFGYLLTQTGRILAVEGEMTVEMANGVAYQLRFGNIAGGGEAAKATDSVDRYLFVTTTWDAARAARYGDSSGSGEKASRDLNARFADWFYIIGGADFQKMRLGRKDVLR